MASASDSVLTAGPTIDAELRERIALRGTARVANYLRAAARGALPNGPEAELLAASGVSAGSGHGTIPFDMWESSSVAAVEARGRGAITAVTATPRRISEALETTEVSGVEILCKPCHFRLHPSPRRTAWDALLDRLRGG